MSTTAASQNGRKITSLLTNETGTADLYRTQRIGTASGTFHRDVFIGRVHYLQEGPYEFQVSNPESLYDPHAGFVVHRDGRWKALADEGSDGLRSRGSHDTVTDAVQAIIGRPL